MLLSALIIIGAYSRFIFVRETTDLKAEIDIEQKKSKQALEDANKKQETIDTLTEEANFLESEKKQLLEDKTTLEKENKRLQEEIAKRKKEAKPVSRGSKPKVKPTQSNGAKGELIGTFEATAYTDDVQSQGKWVGQTATGMKPQVGVIAVDPKVIPLGTKLYVEGYGNAVAGDTGGAIKGNIIDLFMNSRGECRAWGRRQVKVYRR